MVRAAVYWVVKSYFVYALMEVMVQISVDIQFARCEVVRARHVLK